MPISLSPRPFSSPSSSKGFTLIDMAVLLAVVGILAASFIQLYKIQEKEKNLNISKSSYLTVTGVPTFKQIYGRYPCPANPLSRPGDADFGRESCPTVQCPASLSDLVGTCYIPGGRVAANNNGDRIYYGSIPFVTMGISERDTLDSYGNRLTYAVTASATASNTFNKDGGTIAVRDHTDGTYASREVTTGQRVSGLFVILSHGEDGVGAFSSSGALRAPCPTSNPLPPESENCDLDSRFDLGRIQQGDPDTYYDDFLSFKDNETTEVNYWSSVSTIAGVAGQDGLVPAGQSFPMVAIGEQSSVVYNDFCNSAAENNTCRHWLAVHGSMKIDGDLKLGLNGGSSPEFFPEHPHFYPTRSNGSVFSNNQPPNANCCVNNGTSYTSWSPTSLSSGLRCSAANVPMSGFKQNAARCNEVSPISGAAVNAAKTCNKGAKGFKINANNKVELICYQ